MDKGQDKRSSIRVNGKILLKIDKITESQYNRRIENFARGIESPHVDILSRPVLSFDLRPHLKKIREKEESLAMVLDVIDQKLSFIIQAMRHEDEVKGFSTVDADISAAGIAFTSAERMQKGQLLEIQTGLLPDYFFFYSMGRVVRIDDAGDAKYKIAIQFTWLTEEDRERLIEYLFQRQVMQLRMRRIKREMSEKTDQNST